MTFSKSVTVPASKPGSKASTKGEHRVPDSRQRVVLSLLAGGVSAGVAAPFDRWQLTVLLGWNVAAFCYLAIVWGTIAKLDASSTARLATRQDDSRAAVDIVLLLASVISLVGVVAGLAESGREVSVLMVVSVLTVVLSWLTVHSTFTLRYAHLYYSAGGGIDFHGDDPDFSDFAYLAFTVGMAFQVSDTDISSRTIRRTISRHALVSYLFGSVIIGVTINVVGTLVG